MKKLITLLILSNINHAHAINMSADDKKKHLVATTIISSVLYLYTEKPVITYGACLGVGMAKEAYDYIDYGKFDWEDMAANALGCGVGLGLGGGFKWIGNKISYTYRF